jgi:hypothetical protein
MKRVGTFVCALAIGVAWLSFLPQLGPNEADASACYEIYGKTRDLGGGWAHIVVVENDCEYWLQCTLWTDVNPQPPAILTVAARTSEEARITAHSEQQEFRAFGTCRRK